MQVKSVSKSFSSVELAINEVTGYEFFTKYYANIPLLYGRSEATLFYENCLLKDVCSVSDALYKNLRFSIDNTFKYYTKICKTHRQIRDSAGGTQLFFLDRIIRLDSTLEHEYIDWAHKNPTIVYRQMTVQTRDNLVSDLRNEVPNFRYGMCIPSQGDFHERNILTNGTLLDFEGAGWNLLATDIATFIWHTLFAGHYLGLKYAKWATKKDTQLLPSKRPALHGEGKLNFAIPSNRRKLLSDYLDLVYKQLPISKAIEKDIRTAMAFRFFTTFHVPQMSEPDKEICFALANVVYASNYSFYELMDAFLCEQPCTSKS